ncbi:hypothetical protein QVM45_24525, partial [Pseudomonas aeruginosa]
YSPPRSLTEQFCQRHGEDATFSTESFNDVPLATVIDEINRYRPGMLLLLDKALGRRRVQARFSLDQLADVATLIRDAYGIEVTRLPGGVVLLG